MWSKVNPSPGIGTNLGDLIYIILMCSQSLWPSPIEQVVWTLGVHSKRATRKQTNWLLQRITHTPNTMQPLGVEGNP